MNDRKTIADSKRAFHKAFQHVIPPVYRRVADELLVELHLLSHQKDFKIDSIFAIGLVEAFEELTFGYEPEQHPKQLFIALCTSCGFDSNQLKEQANKTIDVLRREKIDDIKTFILNENSLLPANLGKQMESIKDGRFHYSRLFGIGIAKLLYETSNKSSEATSEIAEKAYELSLSIGLPEKRVKKDIEIYMNSIEKLKQSIELIKEAVESEKRKREKSTNK